MNSASLCKEHLFFSLHESRGSLIVLPIVPVSYFLKAARVRQKYQRRISEGVGIINDYHRLPWSMVYDHWCCDMERIFRCLAHLARLQSSTSACGSCGRRRRHSTELNLAGLVKGMRKYTAHFHKLHLKPRCSIKIYHALSHHR